MDAMNEAAADKVRAAMEAYVDRQFARAVYGDAPASTATLANAEPGETLTLEKLEALADSLGPRETWVAWSLATQRGNAIIVNAPDEKVTIFHPDDWPMVERTYREVLSPEQRHNPLFQPTVTFLDADPLDYADRAAWRAKERGRIGDLIAGTITAHVELQQVMRAWWRRLPR